MVTLSAHIEEWPISKPYRIHDYEWTTYRVVVVEIGDGQSIGRGEGSPVFYLGETVESVLAEVLATASVIEGGASRKQLLNILPAGAARAAIDAALWDFEAKTSQKTVWELAEISSRPIKTGTTIDIEESAEKMVQKVNEFPNFDTFKIKVGHGSPIERVAAIRKARPDATLIVDANQGWSFTELKRYASQLKLLNVRHIEQPLRRGADDELEKYDGPVPLCADESCQGMSEYEAIAKRYDIINIKVDKAGGLTAALDFARHLQMRNIKFIVSCMCGTSLNLAPGFVLAHLTDFAELDSHMLLKTDRPGSFENASQLSALSPLLWGI